MTTDAVRTAWARFGLGPQGGATLPDRDGFLAAVEAEIASGHHLLPDIAPLPGSADMLKQIFAYREDIKAFKLASAGMADTPAPDTAAATSEPVKPVSPQRALALAEQAVRHDAARRAPIGFAERLVAFWSNHFAIQSSRSGALRAMAGAYEREAIRPHVFGRFADMLSAVVRHPAMLSYLDNQTSTGPNSPAGLRSGKGLNENLARELMELHTLGVDGGYAQADVTALAAVLTGWAFSTNPQDPAAGEFRFRKLAHEPGSQTIMGETYHQEGMAQGEAVLARLSAHPSTARHIAIKLARHFVADDPPPELVARLTDRFRETGGDLHAVSMTLLHDPLAWDTPPGKFRPPQEFLWAADRLLGLHMAPRKLSVAMETLGQPLWDPPSPAGFKDLSSTWLAPDAITNRLDLADEMAALVRPDVDTAALADLVAASGSEATRKAVMRAESRRQALALLLMSPDFQRR